MTKREYKQAGPWDNEPDELAWTDEKTGYQCQISRNHGGALRGYVCLPETHPLYKVSYGDAVPEAIKPLQDVVLDGQIGKRGVMDVFRLAVGGDFYAGMLFDVHGGITFSDEFKEGGYWYGFDCAHCDDLSPRYESYARGEYRDIEYVKAECASLAKQLKQVAG
jgi:hypothetical protein